jgi:pimeloyl-ACP methyl ester carboxylesterase
VTNRSNTVGQFYPHLGQLALALALGACGAGYAQSVPGHAQGLTEELVSVTLTGDAKQVGVYSTRKGVDKPTKLAVLLPGAPSVVRPVVDGGVMTDSRLTGNFLVRARRFLVGDDVASLIVDCRSDSGDDCSSRYQASRQRQDDVDSLIAVVKSRVPSIIEVWLVGTSMGTLSSSFMPVHNPAGYAGVIHTATITNPYAKGAYRELIGFDYKQAAIPQFFIHHVNDPCVLTPYSGARSIAERYNLPLITVSGGAGLQGAPCEAFSEHGFRGRERDVMNAAAAIIKSGKATQLVIP